MIKISICLALLLMVDQTSNTSKTNVPEVNGLIEGYYEVQGKYADGDYDGLCRIYRLKDHYMFQWILGTYSYDGVAIVKGNNVSVGWAYVKNGKLTLGVSKYELKGQILVGKWCALPTDGKIYNEKLTLLKKSKNGP